MRLEHESTIEQHAHANMCMRLDDADNRHNTMLRLKWVCCLPKQPCEAEVRLGPQNTVELVDLVFDIRVRLSSREQDKIEDSKPW